MKYICTLTMLMLVDAFVVIVPVVTQATSQTVKTDNSSVEGIVSNGVLSFKAIPYMVSPIDNLRAAGAPDRDGAQTNLKASALVGTSWQLVKFQSSDGTELRPDDKSKYTIAFNDDGGVSVRIDCNRGRGTFQSFQPNQLQFSPLALTRAKCPPRSLHDSIVKNWGMIRSYTINNGHLFLSLIADGGIYEFEPIKKAPTSQSNDLRPPITTINPDKPIRIRVVNQSNVNIIAVLTEPASDERSARSRKSVTFSTLHTSYLKPPLDLTVYTNVKETNLRTQVNVVKNELVVTSKGEFLENIETPILMYELKLAFLIGS